MEASTLRSAAGTARMAGGVRFLRLRSDEQLVALFRQGSDEAFSVLHDRYRQRLFSYVRQMLTAGTRADAEDVLQDVFVRAYSGLRADDRPMAARAWLYRVAHNRCVDALRRPAPIPVELSELETSDLQDPLVEASRREDLARLVTDLRRLPDQQRSALLMRELEGLRYAELAQALDCSLAAVKSLLVRARMGLAEAVEARDASCADVRAKLAESCERGVRDSAHARRHMRDCDGCSAYRCALRGTSRGLGALAPPSGPMFTLMKLLGLGGSGAAASGGALLGGGGAVGGGAGIAMGGGAVAVTATKVAVVVCCVAGVAGGAREIERKVAHRTAAPAAAATHAPAAAAAPRGTDERTAAARSEPAPVTRPATAAPVVAAPLVPPDAAPQDAANSSPTGGALAPDEAPVSEVVPASDTVPAETIASPVAGAAPDERAATRNAAGSAPPDTTSLATPASAPDAGAVTSAAAPGAGN